MRILFYVLGFILVAFGSVQLFTDQHTDLLISSYGTVSLVLGAVFLRRAYTNKSLFKRNLLSCLVAVPDKEKKMGVWGAVFLTSSAIIPLLGTEKYFGYNKLDNPISAAFCIILGVIGVVLLWQYLRALKAVCN